MLINHDFSQRAAVTPERYRWVSSPQAGVERVMLDRVGGEKARATSIVRYAPASTFPEHVHPGGEEILVLSGVFADEAADYPAGWYLRNPPGSMHAPSSKGGAIIFVKLWQMPAADQRAVRIDTSDPAAWACVDGRRICHLFEGPGEQVSIQQLVPSSLLLAAPVQGAELLVLGGELHEGHQRYVRGGWLRFPEGEAPVLLAGPDGAVVYLKTGHLCPSTLREWVR